MNISEFRAVAEMRNAEVVLDSRTEELKVKQKNVFNRTIAWLKQKISPNPLATAERQAARNRFLRAIAGDARYDTGDLARAEALMATDMHYRVPLSSRRIREVIAELDERSTEAVRANRETLAHMCGKEVDQRLRARAPDLQLTAPQRGLLEERIREAIRIKTVDGVRVVQFAEAAEITHRKVDEYVEEKAAQAQRRAEALARAQAEPEAEAVRSKSVARGAAKKPRAGAEASSAPIPLSAKAIRPESRQNPLSPKALRRMLDGVELKGKAKPQLKKLIKSGEITNGAALARHANRMTADWVQQNRIANWYAEAEQKLGVRSKVKDGEMISFPEVMAHQVAQMITGSPELLDWPDVKILARDLISAHARSEIEQQAS